MLYAGRLFFRAPLMVVLFLWLSTLSINFDRDHDERYDRTMKATQSNHRSSRSGIVEAYPFGPPKWITTTEETRTFIESLFTAVALDNFGNSFAAALSDDLVWTVTGSSPIAGRYESKQAYITKVLTPLRAVLITLPVPIVEHIFADGDWAVVNWRSEGSRGKNGVNYDMQYAWLIRTGLNQEEQRKIVEVTGFYDSVKVTAVFEGYDFNTTGT